MKRDAVTSAFLQTKQDDALIPIVRIFSVDKAYAFYLDYSGFTLDWEHRFEEGMPLYESVESRYAAVFSASSLLRDTRRVSRSIRLPCA
jgi:hypothetical protein